MINNFLFHLQWIHFRCFCRVKKFRSLSSFSLGRSTWKVKKKFEGETFTYSNYIYIYIKSAYSTIIKNRYFSELTFHFILKLIIKKNRMRMTKRIDVKLFFKIYLTTQRILHKLRSILVSAATSFALVNTAGTFQEI